MVQAQIKAFPGYGVVYPDGVSGIKVVRTFTQGPSKIVNPDGSVSFTTPPPTIHELYGGGFSYAGGSPVTNRKHLQELPSDMREKALKWFDEHGKLSEIAKEDIPPLNLDEKVRPDPVYVLSSDLSTEKDKIREDLDIQAIGGPPPVDFPKLINSISDSIKSLCETVKEHGNQIAEIKKRGPNIAKVRTYNKQKSDIMKAKWTDPDFRAKIANTKKGIKNGNNVTKTSEAV